MASVPPIIGLSTFSLLNFLLLTKVKIQRKSNMIKFMFDFKQWFIIFHLLIIRSQQHGQNSKVEPMNDFTNHNSTIWFGPSNLFQNHVMTNWRESRPLLCIFLGFMFQSLLPLSSSLWPLWSAQFSLQSKLKKKNQRLLF